MRPQNLKTKIFLDSAGSAETRAAVEVFGFLDGQTTNPSLIAKNPETAGKKFTQSEIFQFYKNTVGEISEILLHYREGSLLNEKGTFSLLKRF